MTLEGATGDSDDENSAENSSGAEEDDEPEDMEAFQLNGLLDEVDPVCILDCIIFIIVHIFST